MNKLIDQMKHTKTGKQIFKIMTVDLDCCGHDSTAAKQLLYDCIPLFEKVLKQSIRLYRKQHKKTVLFPMDPDYFIFDPRFTELQVHLRKQDYQEAGYCLAKLTLQRWIYIPNICYCILTTLKEFLQ